MAILIAAFIVYLAFQPRLKGREAKINLAPAPQLSGDHGGPINAGQGVWVKHYDRQGRLSSQLRAIGYAPVSDNAVHVTRPEARFFMSDGQVLRITGREGVVITRTEPGRQAIHGVLAQMPARGRLEEVKLELFSPAQIQRLDDHLPSHPKLTATMNNAVFDSDTFRIYTDDCTIDGKHVPGFAVPVVVSGDDYDFSGLGLLVRWNDRLRRLELLEIHQGDKLVIKHPGRDSGFGIRDQALSTAPQSTRPAPAEVVQADSAPAPRAATASQAPAHGDPRPTADVPPSFYRADFDQNVRIFQNNQLLATAATLRVDFRPKEQSNTPAATTATSPTAHVEAPSTAPSAAAPSKTSASPAATQAASPLIVRWTGPLRITPLQSPAGDALQDGQAAIQLLGSPVTLSSRGNVLRAATVTYRTANDEAMLSGDARTPVTLTDPRGSTVTTQTMLYQPRRQQARLSGKGHATGLVQSDNSRRQDTLDATWTHGAILHFRPTSDTSDRQMDLTSALLEGDVLVSHPQVHLSSDQLSLIFDPSAAASSTGSTRPAQNSNELRSLLAVGHVKARLQDKQNGEQRLEAGRLKLVMAHVSAGRAYPRLVQADDEVAAYSLKQDQHLWADHLTVTFASVDRPTTQPRSDQPAVALQSLDATGQVRVQDPRNTARGSDLHVVMNDNQPDVTLRGEPAILAGQNDQRLSGPVIHYVPAESRASVEGPGQIVAAQTSVDGKAHPFHASWQKGILVDGRANHIILNGHVAATSEDADGGELSAQGDTLTLLLAEAPTTQSQNRSADSARLVSGDLLQNKQVRQAVFTGHASLQSLLTVNDRLQRRLYLQSPVIEYNLIAQRLVVPQAGRMLVEDHQPSAASATAPSPRGNTAFAWSRKFTFDQSAHQAMLLGDVRIIHQPDATTSSSFPFQLQAQRVTAEFSPASTTTTAGHAADAAALQLRRLKADGMVRIDSQGREVDAADIAYDPATAILTATGHNNGVPVRLQNADGSLRGQFESLTYNLKNDQIIRMTDAQFQGRP